MYSQYSEVIPQRETERPFKSYAHSTAMSNMPSSTSGYYGMAHMSAHQMFLPKKECGYANGMSMSASPQDFSMSLPISIRSDPSMRGESLTKSSDLISAPPVAAHMDSTVNQSLSNDMGINMIMDDIMKSNKQHKHDNSINSIVDAIITNKSSNQDNISKFQDPTTSSSSNGSPPTENPSSSSLEEKSSDDHFRMPPKKRPLSVPDESKDEMYWEKRMKNNESAKRSREARRMKEEQIAVRVVYLEQENLQLRTEVTLLKSEIEKLRCMLYTS